MKAPPPATAGSDRTYLGTALMSEIMDAPKKHEPGSLEDQLDKALRNNPDIRAADAKVREVEARLNQVRHGVIAKVVSLRGDIELAKKMLKHSELLSARMELLRRNGSNSADETAAAQAGVDKQKAELAKLEGELEAVLGTSKYRMRLYNTEFAAEELVSPSLSAVLGDSITQYQGMIHLSKGAASVQAPMAERIRAALDKKVNLEESREELPFDATLAYFAKKANIDVPFRVLGKPSGTISLMKAELTVGAWLQVFEDSVPNVRFVVREYGILVTTRERVPEGSMTVQNFWKRSKVEVKTGRETKTPPSGSSAKP